MSKLGKACVHVVPFMADVAQFENASELNGNIAIVPRGDRREKNRGDLLDQAKRAAEAGAVGLIVVNQGDNLVEDWSDAFEDEDTAVRHQKFDVPVLMIASSDAARLLEHGSARIRDKGTIVVVIALFCFRFMSRVLYQE